MLNLASEKDMKIKEITSEGLGAQYKIIKTGPEGTVLQSPDMHTTLQLDPQASKGIVQNPNNPNQFTLSQAQATGTTDQQQTPIGPKVGGEVEVPANEDAGGGGYDIETTITNPNFDDSDENSYSDISVGINYSISGEDRDATWGYHGGEPPEYAEIDEVTVVNLETGEDITDLVDSDELDSIIWDHEKKKEMDETVGGDSTDEYIDSVTDQEFEKANKPSSKELDHIKRLSGI